VFDENNSTSSQITINSTLYDFINATYEVRFNNTVTNSGSLTKVTIPQVKEKLMQTHVWTDSFSLNYGSLENGNYNMTISVTANDASISQTKYKINSNSNIEATFHDSIQRNVSVIRITTTSSGTASLDSIYLIFFLPLTLVIIKRKLKKN
ncbi:MAG: hypothetical protein ACFFD1_11880, partial [Candidatus Thorarchaeota archaeon]